MASEKDPLPVEIVNENDWDGNERRKEVTRQQHFRWFNTLWIITFTLVVLYMYQQNRDRSQEGQSAKTALCVFKHDLVTRAGQTQQFLDEHPAGFAGIPRTTLQTSLNNQRATIKSLNSLHCPGIPG